MNKLLMALPLAGLILAGCESPHKFDVSPDQVVIAEEGHFIQSYTMLTSSTGWNLNQCIDDYNTKRFGFNSISKAERPCHGLGEFAGPEDGGEMEPFWLNSNGSEKYIKAIQHG